MSAPVSYSPIPAISYLSTESDQYGAYVQSLPNILKVWSELESECRQIAEENNLPQLVDECNTASDVANNIVDLNLEDYTVSFAFSSNVMSGIAVTDSDSIEYVLTSPMHRTASALRALQLRIPTVYQTKVDGIGTGLVKRIVLSELRDNGNFAREIEITDTSKPFFTRLGFTETDSESTLELSRTAARALVNS